MKRQGWDLIESKIINTVRLWEELVPRIRRPAGILRGLSVYCCFCPRSSLTHFLTNQLSLPLSGGWLPITLSFASQVPAIRKPVFPPQFQIPQDSGVAYIRHLSLTSHLWPGSGVMLSKPACPCSAHPEGEMGR